MKKLIIVVLLFTTGIAFGKLKVGDLAPDFTLPDIRTGEEISLSSFHGQVIVLRIWRVCRGRCRVVVPHLKRLQTELLSEIYPNMEEVRAEYGPLLKILSINAIDPRRRVMSELNKYKMDYQVLEGKGSGIVKKYRVVTLPLLVIIDKDGIIRFIEMYPTYNQLKEVIVPLIRDIVENGKLD
ncbi:MAG: TlpA family protein disulfide reductase [candidate division Zixibacteria bacterium]|nr:TlpA family protein disulfide reductase [Candidatus Tariuqbacter arcticus]